MRRALETASKITDLPLLLRLDSGNDSIENIDVVLDFNECHAKRPSVDFIIKWNSRRGDKDDWLAYAESKSRWEQPREGKRDAIYKQLEEKLLSRDLGRVIKLQTLSRHMAEVYVEENVMIKVLSIVIAMLIFIVALGIVGLAIFWNNQRTNADWYPPRPRRHPHQHQPALSLPVLAVCALILVGVSLAAALIPALRAANIPPATATRSV